MKSKQINFFLSPEDLPEVEAFLSERHCLILKRNDENPETFHNYDIVNNREDVFQVCLCTEEFKEKIFYKHIESTDGYFIDIPKSFCIEFSIGGFYPYSNKELHSSRFYYVFEFYKNGRLVRKSEEFIRWADDIIKDFKNKFLIKEPKYSKDFLSVKFIEWVKMNKAAITKDGTKFIV